MYVCTIYRQFTNRFFYCYCTNWSMMFFNIHTRDLKTILATPHWMLKSTDISGKPEESTHLRSWSSLFLWARIPPSSNTDRLMRQCSKTCISVTASWWHWISPFFKSHNKHSKKCALQHSTELNAWTNVFSRILTDKQSSVRQLFVTLTIY